MMEMHDQKRTAKYSRNLKAIRRFFVVLLIFCLAECAVGSCLSYGHSCWGAHGKRSSESRGTPQYRPIRDERNGRAAVAEDETDGKPAATSDQDRWLFSRLITGRLAVPAVGPIVGKRPSNRWHQKQSIRSLPENWNINYGTNTNGIIRNENSDSVRDSKDSDDSVDLPHHMEKGRDERTDFLYVPSRKEYPDHRSSLRQKLRLYKILTDSFNDDTLQ